MTIPAFLLAAGRGTRLAPITNTTPKCLVPILGQPILAFWIDVCVRAHFAPIYINTSYLAPQVEHFVAHSVWRNDIILLHEKQLLGTGGTLLKHKTHLEHGTFFVAHADNLSFFDMSAFLYTHKHRPSHCLLTAMLFRSPTPSSCGIVELNNESVITAFHEKVARPPSNLANGAVYFMEPDVFPLLEKSANPQPDISCDLLPHCIGSMATYLNSDYHRDIGTPESYSSAQKEMVLRFPQGILPFSKDNI